jgi:hypothetical protein
MEEQLARKEDAKRRRKAEDEALDRVVEEQRVQLGAKERHEMRQEGKDVPDGVAAKKVNRSQFATTEENQQRATVDQIYQHPQYEAAEPELHPSEPAYRPLSLDELRQGGSELPTHTERLEMHRAEPVFTQETHDQHTGY